MQPGETFRDCAFERRVIADGESFAGVLPGEQLVVGRADRPAPQRGDDLGRVGRVIDRLPSKRNGTPIDVRMRDSSGSSVRVRSSTATSDGRAIRRCLVSLSMISQPDNA